MTKPPNAKRTGGPRTVEGKSVASLNAVKTGFYSAQIILAGESEEEFLLLEQQLFQDFRVEGVVESNLAHDLAVLMWKRLRLERIERSVIVETLNRHPTLSEFNQIGLSVSSEALDAICGGIEDDQEVIEAYEIFSVLLEEHLKQRKFSEADLEAFERDFGPLFGLLVEKARGYGLSHPSAKNLANAMYGTESNRQPLLSYVYQDVKRIFDGRVWAMKHRDAIEDAIAKIKDVRLLTVMLGEKSARASDALARSFYRTLGELRKQQGWRRSMAIIEAVRDDV